MARMVVVYRTPEDVEAFNRHYFETHVPLARKLPGLRKYEVSRGSIASPTGPSAAYMVATLHFDDMAALRKAFGSEEGQACAADRQRFAPDTSSFQTFLFESEDLLLSGPKGTAVPSVSRVNVHKAAEISAPSGDVWSLLIDWAGMLRWWLPAERGGLPGPTLVKCDLIGEYDAVPRTRRMTLDSGAVVEEKLFYQDNDSRRIHYVKSEPPGSPISGYIATSYVDVIDDDRCTLHISSSFDVQLPADVQATASRFEIIYEAIFRGFQNYFSTKRV